MEESTKAQMILKTNATTEQRCEQEEETHLALRQLPDNEVDAALAWALEQSDSTMHWFVLPLIGNHFQNRKTLIPLIRKCLLSDDPLVATAAIACLTNLRDKSSDTERVVRELHNTLTSPWSKVITLGYLLLCHSCKDSESILIEIANSGDVLAGEARNYLSGL